MKKNKVLILKKLNKDLTSVGGFKYPESGKVEASDFEGSSECGDGLLWGTGDFDTCCLGEKYCILEVEASQLVNFGNKVQFRSGKVVLVTKNQRKAYNYLYKRSPEEYRNRINFAIQVTYFDNQIQGGGCGSTQKVGNWSTQKAGYESTQTAGRNSTQTAGFRSTQKAGDYSIQSAECRSIQTAVNGSTQTSKDKSTQTAGRNSTQTAGWNSIQTAETMSTQTAEDESTQTAGYRSTQTAGDESTQTAENYSTQTAGYRSTQKAGDESTQTAEDCSTQTAGNGSTQTAGDSSTHIILGTDATITTGKNSVVTFLKLNGERVVFLSGKDFPVDTETKFVDCKVV